IQILGMRNFGEMERVRWRAADNRDAMIHDGAEPRRARHPAEGQDERSVLRGRFLSGPEADERSERECEAEAIGRGRADHLEYLPPAIEHRLPRLRRIEPAQRPAGRSPGRLV